MTLNTVDTATFTASGAQAYDISGLGSGALVGYRVWVNGLLLGASEVTLAGSTLSFEAGTQRDGTASFVMVEVTRTHDADVHRPERVDPVRQRHRRRHAARACR